MRTIIDFLYIDPPSQPVDIVVPVSGGKDSQACMKLACELRDLSGLNVVGLFCDTKFEHPWTYEHVERIERLYDVEVLRARNPHQSKLRLSGIVDSPVAVQGIARRT